MAEPAYQEEEERPSALRAGGAIATAAAQSSAMPPSYANDDVAKPRFKAAAGGGPAIGDADHPDHEPLPVPSYRQYKDLQTQNPALYDAVNHVSQEEQVPPYVLSGLVRAAQDQPDDGRRLGLTGLTADDARYFDPRNEHDLVSKFRDDPLASIYFGAQKYKALSRRYGNDPVNTAAAYFAGPEAVDTVLGRHGDDHRNALPEGTLDFVNRFLGRDALETVQGDASRGGPPPELDRTIQGDPSRAGAQPNVPYPTIEGDASRGGPPPTAPYPTTRGDPSRGGPPPGSPPSLESLARQAGGQPPERFVPQQGAVPPIVPNAPQPVRPDELRNPAPLPRLPTEESEATRQILQERDQDTQNVAPVAPVGTRESDYNRRYEPPPPPPPKTTYEQEYAARREEDTGRGYAEPQPEAALRTRADVTRQELWEAGPSLPASPRDRIRDVPYTPSQPAEPPIAPPPIPDLPTPTPALKAGGALATTGSAGDVPPAERAALEVTPATPPAAAQGGPAPAAAAGPTTPLGVPVGPTAAPVAAWSPGDMAQYTRPGDKGGPITVEGVTYPSQSAWNRAMDAKARATAQSAEGFPESPESKAAIAPTPAPTAAGGMTSPPPAPVAGPAAGTTGSAPPIAGRTGGARAVGPPPVGTNAPSAGGGGADAPVDRLRGGPSAMTPQGIVRAGSEGGPNGLLTYTARNASRGSSMGAAWGQAGEHLARAMILKGDMQGVMHAEQYIHYMQHKGAMENLMQAIGTMDSDPNTAAQYLARSHAFVTDGSTASFQVIGNKIYGQRYDEDTHDKIGKPFEVTAQGLRMLAIAQSPPEKFFENLKGERTTNETARHNTMDEKLRGESQTETKRSHLADETYKWADLSQRGAISERSLKEKQLEFDQQQARLKEQADQAERVRRDINDQNNARIREQKELDRKAKEEADANRIAETQRQQAATAAAEKVAHANTVNEEVTGYYGIGNAKDANGKVLEGKALSTARDIHGAFRHENIALTPEGAADLAKDYLAGKTELIRTANDDGTPDGYVAMREKTTDGSQGRILWKAKEGLLRRYLPPTNKLPANSPRKNVPPAVP